ncbi:MAG: cupin domain-containing protein [Burkholderiaceae bacterium]
MDPLTVDDRYAGMIADLAVCHAQPLWDRYQRVTTRAPAARDEPMAWPWQLMQPLIARATREVAMQDAERRVLLLTHPAFAGAVATTTNLSAGLQTLLPGETARAHRHSLQAIRFVMSGSGAVTTVNDQRCAMNQGDLVLTPAWTWHEHVHPGSEPLVWFDGLDLPLLHHLDSMFFELAGPLSDRVDPPPTRAAVAPWTGATLRPDGSAAGGAPADRYRFSWTRASQALDEATCAADGSRCLRYVDGVSQGAVLPTLDCYLLACAAGRPTLRYRTTSNAVCVVAQGHGRSEIGAETIEWQRNDVFTLPHWNWIRHTATSSDATIFLMTDREFLASLGYLREEEEQG